jgi:hypothetical protein
MTAESYGVAGLVPTTSTMFSDLAGTTAFERTLTDV